MDENQQQILQHAKMDGNNSRRKSTGRRKNKKVRKPFHAEDNKTQELDNAGTLELEHVLGLTVFSNSALTCDPMTGLVAYPAGCVLVLLDCVKYKQLGTLHTPRRSITAAKFSPDGRYVLTGESGLHPAVRVWELNSMTEVATLKGHSVGIISVSFSPRMREIIVVGDAQDMMISVWAWPSKIMKTLNKFADEIYAMAVAEDSSFFTTVGNRHVKFYYLDNLRTLPPHINSTCPIPLPTRCGILDNLKENCFCDVVCGRGCSSLYIFVVAMSGILCQINRDRYLERWVNVNMINACCLTADENCIFVGGTQGVVRMFRALDLQIITTLPRPHILGLDISQVTTSYFEDMSENASVSTLEEDSKEKESTNRYPTTRAITYDSCHEILTVVYGDRSIYIWSRCKQDLDGSHMYCFNKKYSSMYHRGCVWGLTTYPAVLDSDPEEAALGGALPPGALISVSADGTLRAWDVCANICEESMLKRNCVSAECLKIVYADKMDTTKKLRQQIKPREGSFVRHGKQSFSAVTVCPDGLHIATGNQHGRVCIYDTNTMNVMTTMLAHEAEVTALGYSITKRYKVLASGSRDRMIHVMDASHGYQLLTTLDDHSSTITAINFTYIARCILMVTSSLDMSVLIRAYLDSSVFSFKPVRAIVEKKSVVDFAINQWSGLIAMACQDRLVRVYSIISSVESTTFRGCPSHGGQLVKIEIDPSGQYLLTACSNRTINLLQSVTYSVKREMAEMGKLTRGMVLGERWKKSRLVTGVLPLDVRSEPEFNLMTESASDLKVDLSLYNIQDRNYRATADDSKYRIKIAPCDTDTVESNDCIVIKKLSDINSNIWTPGAMPSIAIGPHRDDGCSIKARDKQGQNSQTFHSYLNNHIPSTTLSPTSEAWLSACYERRRIFKLEARSIKKILAMMRLVTDAMEKDLAGNNWLMYSSSGINTSNHLPHTYCSPDVSAKRMGLMMPTSLRSLQQQQQQPDQSMSTQQSIPSAADLSVPSGLEQSMEPPSRWMTEQENKDSSYKFLPQHKMHGPSLLKLQTASSLLNTWHDQMQAEKVPVNWVPECESSSPHTIYTGIENLYSDQRPQRGTACLKRQRTSRIPVRNGSGLTKSISRCSKVPAVEASVENNTNEDKVDTFGYLRNVQNYNYSTMGHKRPGESQSSPVLHSSCTDSCFLDASLHCYNEHGMEGNQKLFNDDSGNGHEISGDIKHLQYCASKTDNSLNDNRLVSNVGTFLQEAEEEEHTKNVCSSDCCLKTEFGNMDVITNTGNYALEFGMSCSSDVSVKETEHNNKENKAGPGLTVGVTTSFEDFFNSVAMFEALSDELPSVCELVDDETDVILEETDNSRNSENINVETRLNCIVHEHNKSGAEFNQFTRIHRCSSVEVLCGEGGVLLENKDRCVGGGDGDKASEFHNKDIFMVNYGNHDTHYCPKSVLYNNAECAGSDMIDSSTKSPSLIIFDQFREEFE